MAQKADPALNNSSVHAHALYLRADARLALSPPEIDGSIADALLATQLRPNERKGWRALANAYEADGNAKGAIEAIANIAKVDPSFSTKAKNEIERLRG